jgi:hypothetical protein
MGALKVLNPALRPPIWSGSRLVPRGYALRLPGAQSESEIAAALGAHSRLAALPRAAQRRRAPRSPRRDLAGIAAASGMSLPGWRRRTAGIPAMRSRAASRAHPDAAHAGGSGPARRPYSPRPRRERRRGRGRAATRPPPPRKRARTAALEKTSPPRIANATRRSAAAAAEEPVSARQTESAALLPAGPPTGSRTRRITAWDRTDTVVVQVAETLGISRTGATSTARRCAA